jgi:sterol desaturase/sphingolipid hydroxylase (fatty acid hydroxylase superfamily)
LAFGPTLIGLWVTAGGDGTLGSEGGAGPMAASPLLFAAILGPFYVLVAGLERVWPHRAAWQRAQGDVGADIGHLVLTGPGSNQVAQVLTSGLALAIVGSSSRAAGGPLWPTGLPVLVQVWWAVVIAEFGHYVFHRISHEVPLVWRVHAVHHGAPRLYWLNATRFHPLDLVALVLCQTLPLLLLGIPARVLLIYSICGSCYGQLQHANIAFPRSGWSRFFSTPELHRWHHSTDPAEGNANYGAILILWDQLLGTLFRPASREFTGPVGNGLAGFPSDYVGQMRAPFRWSWGAGGAAPDSDRSTEP